MKKKNKDDIQPPKRARKAIAKLHKLVKYMEFYMGTDDKFRNHIIKELASPIEEVLHELSVEKNIDHIKLATKLKTIWAKEQETKIDEIVEDRLDDAVEQRLDDLKEMSKGEL